MNRRIELEERLKEDQLGKRLDKAIAELFPNFSRSRLKEWLISGKVTLDGKVVTKPRKKVTCCKDVVILTELQDESCWKAQDIPLNIVYEDRDIIVLNKPGDFIVHPGAGRPDGSVLNALLFHHPEAALLPRAGIVHRLDKDTTGLMVVAKTISAYTGLVDSLQRREVTREYEAITSGSMIGGGTVNKPIARHRRKRTLMAVSTTGKAAITYYRVAERFREYTRIILRLGTGRTHQIRVHMSYIQYPLLADKTYGRSARAPVGASERLTQRIHSFDRQALHATMLRFEHPTSGERVEFHAPIPDDMRALLEAFRDDVQKNPVPLTQ